ncbi:sugar phosphate isomerase/epimerase [Opitutaceae bacterium TAV4]|nr:sugar phosphate isomerase/epimerase [Opitutaceae bacterium TAV4]RRK00433.1 sugar phosphate isomerase/epimerase [Opitutaceae bacterium TAV3]
MSKIPVSLQLYSLRELVKTDFAATVAEVARIGYAGVETAGYGNLDATGAAKAIADVGLKVSGQHIGLAALRADLNKVISDAHLLGTTNIICPSTPRDLYRSPAAVSQLGEELDELGARLRAHGIQFHYHNHAFEFVTLEGRYGLDWLLDAAAPRNLLCQADVFWVRTGGKNPAQFIREQGRRIKLLHLKDEKEIGGGPVDFAEIFAAVESVGALEWYVVEVGQYNHPPLESVRLSLEQLKQWGIA